MDITEKKRLANEKRLKALREWQKNKNKNAVKEISNDSSEIAPKNKVTIYKDDEEDTVSHQKNQPEKNKFNLFESEEEDDDNEDFEDCFKRRPQFEGSQGLKNLELSSKLPERFKLDDRFNEDEEPNKEEAEDTEKDKYHRILQNVLGHDFSEKFPVNAVSKTKRGIERFDPEDEADKSFVKEVESASKKPRKKIRKTAELPTTEKEVPYSSERYIEVSSNLKDIMSSTGTFSFTEKFSFSNDAKEKDANIFKDDIFEKNQQDSRKEPSSFSKVKNTFQDDFSANTNFIDPFFISDTDERLKEGVAFFIRPDSMDKIRQEWDVKKNAVLEIFRKRKKSAMRNTVKRPNKSRTQKRHHQQRTRK